MSDVTRILDRVQQGDPKAAEELLPLVYDELRKVAGQKMGHEAAGHTLQPTALVHEAWLRLTGAEEQHWKNRGHFFAAAAEAMRRILVESARRKQRLKHGGELERTDLDNVELPLPMPEDDLLALDEALVRLAALKPCAADLVNLCFFVGLTQEQAAGGYRGRNSMLNHGGWQYVTMQSKNPLTPPHSPSDGERERSGDPRPVTKR